MTSLVDVTLVINQLLPEPHAGLLSGILFGTKANLDTVLTEALIRSGTLHIVALSGMNITIICNLTATTLLHVFSRRITSLLTVLIIIGFVLFVGPSPSVVRAAVMGCLALLSTVFGRQKHALFLLLMAGMSMLIVMPSYITNSSFQLSFLATLGLILFSKPADGSPLVATDGSDSFASKSRRHIVTFVKDDFRTTLAAQVFTIPIFVFQFHRLSVLSPVANLLIGWIIVPLTVVGLAMTTVGLLWLPLGTLLSWVVWIFLQYILVVIFAISTIPFSSLQL